MQFRISRQGFTQMKPKQFKAHRFDFNLEEPDCEPIDDEKLQEYQTFINTSPIVKLKEDTPPVMMHSLKESIM